VLSFGVYSLGAGGPLFPALDALHEAFGVRFQTPEEEFCFVDACRATAIFIFLLLLGCPFGFGYVYGHLLCIAISHPDEWHAPRDAPEPRNHICTNRPLAKGASRLQSTPMRIPDSDQSKVIRSEILRAFRLGANERGYWNMEVLPPYF